MGSSGGSSEHFLRNLSSSDPDFPPQEWAQQAECGGGGRRGGSRRVVRVMVVVDQSSSAKHAMMWALTHVASKSDFLTLLHVLPPGTGRGSSEEASALANSLGSLCKACKPEVEVEALVIQGPKLSTVLSQVKKLEASVLVLSQPKPSPFCWYTLSSPLPDHTTHRACHVRAPRPLVTDQLCCSVQSFMRSSSEEFVEECISRAECLTMAVRRQSNGVGGYLISTRWQKNFWLLA
ncbi:hypothetical protein PR202_gb01314 [Eleusine coracana subsp. coracana]|uniref:UspA domain-containing protein n=1 Tax=Eleusine coracana subsp. coracana TaxID=191504 RepID=A0AAV5DW61_ELECO|nr:hypothetical protein PR202_gb01314 [Eleusine coracana subsp. coracana]